MSDGWKGGAILRERHRIRILAAAGPVSRAIYGEIPCGVHLTSINLKTLRGAETLVKNYGGEDRIKLRGEQVE